MVEEANKDVKDPKHQKTVKDMDKHPRITLIVVKKVMVPPTKGQLECLMEYGYVEGASEEAQ